WIKRSASEKKVMLLPSLSLLLVLPAAEPAVDAHGDPLPPGAVARLGTTRFRHSDEIIGATFSTDGKRLISASRRDGIRIWDRDTGKLLQTAPLTQEAATTRGLRLEPRYGTHSPDGKIHAAQLEKMIRLTDPVTEKEVGRVPVPHAHADALMFAPDSKLLAVIHRDRFVLFDVARNDIRHEVRLTLPNPKPIPPSADPDFGGPEPVLVFAP